MCVSAVTTVAANKNSTKKRGEISKHGEKEVNQTDRQAGRQREWQVDPHTQTDRLTGREKEGEKDR